MADQKSTPPKAKSTGNGGAITPPTGTEFTPAEPLASAGVEFDAAGGNADAAETKPATVTQLFRDGATRLTGDAADRARSYAEEGKARAGSALDELAKMMTDAAGTVDDKLGEQFGQYARTAADTVSGFSDSLKSKEIDDLIADARAFVQKSPAVAIGTAAAIGFVLVRLIKSGLETTSDDRA